MKKYKCILADPPWDYGDRKKYGKEFDYKKRQYKKTIFGGGADDNYNLMSTEDICSLPVKEITDENSVLFLWSTFPKLVESFKVIESWGFSYKTLGFNWVKLNKDKTPFLGVGYYTRSNSEVCLFATKGTNKPKTHSISSILFTHRFRQHSRKPDIVYLLIERLFDGPYLELFSRRQKEGWDVWGNQIESNFSFENI